MKKNTIRVIHSMPVWLQQTNPWLYNQVRYLPKYIETHVVCEQTTLLDQFIVPNIHSLYETSRIQYYWEKGLRKLHLRYLNLFSHVGHVAKITGSQILHSHFGHIGWFNLNTARRSGMKHVVTFYGVDVNKFPSQDFRWGDRYQTLFSQADMFLCEGPFMAKSLVALGCPKEKINLHHLGIQIENIPYCPRSWQAGEPLRILITASFREKKGIPYALDAIGIMQSKVDIEVTIIGNANHEPHNQREKKRILDVIKQHKFHQKVRMLGFQPYPVFLKEAYQHHIFISPSVTASDGDTEGGAPVSLIDMMATGMPIVSTNHCDIPEIVRYGVDDWLVDERDVHGLVDRLKWLIGHREEWRAMLDVGRRYCEKEFDANLQGKKLAHIYQSFLSFA